MSNKYCRKRNIMLDYTEKVLLGLVVWAYYHKNRDDNLSKKEPSYCRDIYPGFIDVSIYHYDDYMIAKLEYEKHKDYCKIDYINYMNWCNSINSNFARSFLDDKINSKIDKICEKYLTEIKEKNKVKNPNPGGRKNPKTNPNTSTKG